MDLLMFCATAAVYRYSMTASLHSANSSSNPKSTVATGLTYDVLAKQNAETSTAIMEALSESPAFLALAKSEGDMTVSRDEEDALKLDKGIEFAKSKGVLDSNFRPEPYVDVDVLGKTPPEVADEILSHVEAHKEGDSTGGVLVLVGLSGTGKGTTVVELRSKLEAQGKQVVTWSNGNLFRSVTLLATTWCEQQGMPSFDPTKALLPENTQKFMAMLSFGFINGKYDTRINGLGMDYLVSEVQNTVLKSPAVSKNIPTVAQSIQGEVITFAADAVKTMASADNVFVLLEGREQTVDYVLTPHRFRLMLSDPTLIGKRRAAQRLVGALLATAPKGASTDVLVATLATVLDKMVQEIE